MWYVYPHRRVPSRAYVLVPGCYCALLVNMSNFNSLGYGPNRNNLIFNGDPEKFELWEVKFLSYLRLRKLNDVVDSTSPDQSKNAEVYAELVQVLDDRSLSLIMRDAADDGKKAISILRGHYSGKSKPRIISMYTDLTSLKIE